MKRDEAVSCLKEILLGADVPPEFYSILGFESEDPKSEGFKIKVYAQMDEVFRTKIISITKERGLTLLELEKQIIIYKSKV